jgi:hypothetical protein
MDERKHNTPEKQGAYLALHRAAQALERFMKERTNPSPNHDSERTLSIFSRNYAEQQRDSSRPGTVLHLNCTSLMREMKDAIDSYLKYADHYDAVMKQ